MTRVFALLLIVAATAASANSSALEEFLHEPPGPEDHARASVLAKTHGEAELDSMFYQLGSQAPKCVADAMSSAQPYAFSTECEPHFRRWAIELRVLCVAICIRKQQRGVTC